MQKINFCIQKLKKCIQKRKKQSKVKESKEKEKTHVVRGDSFTQLITDQCFSSDLENAVTEWIQYKTEKRQGYKETGLKSLLSQIKKNAEEQIKKPNSFISKEDRIKNRMAVIDSWV